MMKRLECIMTTPEDGAAGEWICRLVGHLLNLPSSPGLPTIGRIAASLSSANDQSRRLLNPDWERFAGQPPDCRCGDAVGWMRPLAS
ncbi:unnamed protein product [Protopolystoma xenopodis]|uniref:Uncharacterized protein n=1 Tax=Protopolystoma xenopodis TaxID=117903 RepID=A0A448WXW6_9PLAT|nr:unnamed protein product [Protopolystoma xenopodis]